MNAVEVASQHGLHRVGARPSILTYLRETWERRDFAIAMARFRIQAADEKNRLGAIWMVLRPTLNALVYGLIFGVLQGNARPPDYPAYVVIGVFLWDFFNSSLNDGAKSITGNRSLVQSLAFPRMTLPFSVVVQNFMSLVPMLGVMFIYLMLLGHFPRWQWILLVPLLAIYSVFNLGIAMIAARLTVHVRDLTQILPFVTRILFYTSGVLFDVSRLLHTNPILVKVYDWHPVYEVLQIGRGILMGGTHTYDHRYWLYLSLWAVVVGFIGTVFFWRAEERYGRD